MTFEEEYQDILQNIESEIASVYREHPDIQDSSVMRMLEAVIDNYVAQQRQRPPKRISLSEEEDEMFARVKWICDWRLGKQETEELPGKPKTTEEILLCLKRIQKSAKKWNKHGGIRGYLDFVTQFV